MVKFLRRGAKEEVRHKQEERRAKVKDIFIRHGLVIREGFTDFSEKLYKSVESILAQLGKGPDWKYLHDHKPPGSGYYLVAVNTDDGQMTQVLWYNKDKDYFVYEGEPTFCRSYMFSPYAWDYAPEPPLVDEGEHDEE